MKLTIVSAIAALRLAATSAFAPAQNRIVTPTRITTRTAANYCQQSTTALTMSSDTWYEADPVITLVPKFKIKEGMKEQYIALLPKFVELVKANEAGTCVHYGFVGPTEDDFVICREGYISAEGLLKHLDNVGDVLNEALQYADIVELQCQGPAAELEKLKEPLAAFSPDYYPLAEGSLRSKKEW